MISTTRCPENLTNGDTTVELNIEPSFSGWDRFKKKFLSKNMIRGMEEINIQSNRGNVKVSGNFDPSNTLQCVEDLIKKKVSFTCEIRYKVEKHQEAAPPSRIIISPASESPPPVGDNKIEQQNPAVTSTSLEAPEAAGHGMEQAILHNPTETKPAAAIVGKASLDDATSLQLLPMDSTKASADGNAWKKCNMFVLRMLLALAVMGLSAFTSLEKTIKMLADRVEKRN